MIKRLFVANRGEIVRRIAISAHAQGIETVAITHGIPPEYLTGIIDHFVNAPSENASLYTDGEAMLKLALASGCDAIHPGYGFLSENAAFVSLVNEAGLTFVGPSAKAVALMGNKANARRLALSCAVAPVPGINLPAGLALNVMRDKIEAFALDIGYPILIKSATGGGGRGMRRITRPDELDVGALQADPEIRRGMADGGIIVEKYIERPRHIEVQIVADQMGTVITLGDRECSLQRRFQKVIEEAPAFINENTRSAMHAAAVRLASAASYFSVGTVEFLVDASSSDPMGPAQFYFLEMNTRLQVEHTVTEQVFGVDLVALQLRIAMGAALPEELKANLRPRGVSIQARIYAEKVADGFLPAPGMVHSFVPCAAPFMRWEVGIDAIDEVSMDFDPMVAKAIASGTTRIEAINRLALALKKSVYTGTESNIAFLIAVLEDQQFRNHNFDTHFIEKNLSRLIEVIASRKTALATSGSALFADARLFAGHVPAKKLAQTDVGHLTRQIFSTKKPISDDDHAGPRLIVCEEQTKHSRRHRYITSRIGRGLVDLNGDGQMHDLWFVETAVNGHPPERHLCVDGVTLKQERKQRPRYGAFTSDDRGATSAMAPVPGRVLGISVIKGAQVLKNDILLTIESMKMEFAVRAPCDLTVSEIKVAPGALVRADETLVVW